MTENDENKILENYTFLTTRTSDGLYRTETPQIPGLFEVAEDPAQAVEKMRSVVILKSRGA